MSEIVDDEPLVIRLLRQREDKGDSIFLYDSQYMHYEQKVSSWWCRGTTYVFRVINNGDVREILYDADDLEHADFQKRSANTWSVVIKNEAD